MDKTARLINKTYKKINAKNMASLTNRKRDNATIKFFLKFLKKTDYILDLACGYGRITIPLVKKGFRIEGIDLVSSLIKEAKRKTKKEGIDIKFRIGDMRRLPYKNESFDKVLCLWSSFNHLLTKKDQVKALKEIYRILRKKGICIIDLPNFENKWSKEQIKKYGRVVPYMIKDVKVIDYVHDKRTLKNIAKLAGFKKHIIKFENIDHRRRIIFILKK
ncbi:class I SAM-dependent methyltransferase [Candidatus Pacearchaeota archaeon]|nr:class I SAM-dependent methyltransferase [Candidatus Pacearchaeota archaeon]